MKSNMSVRVEFLGGTDVKDAVAEAKAKAESWDVAYVCFNFNGTNFSIGRGCDISAAANEWSDHWKDSSKGKLGIIHP